jgi:transcriptional regulator with XRE-family HTH domain
VAKTRPIPTKRTPDYAIRLAKEFGRRLQEVRIASGMDQQSFAESLAVSRTTVSNIERGTQRVFLDQVYRAAEILGRTPAELLPEGSRPNDLQVRAASDDPLPAHAERSFEKVIREMTEKYRTSAKD